MGRSKNELKLLYLYAHLHNQLKMTFYGDCSEAEWCEVNITVVTLVQSPCYSKGFVN